MNYLNDAGPLIWLVLILGLLALVAAVRFVTRRQPGQATMALGSTVASVIVALLATVVGFQKSVGGLREVAADDRWIYLFGLQESLNNLVVAGVFAFIVTVLLTIGRSRQTA